MSYNICKNCSKEFSKRVYIEGKQYSLSSRMYCLDCNPLGERRFWKGKRVEEGIRGSRVKVFLCNVCGKEKREKTRNITCSTCRNKKQRNLRRQKAIELFGGKCLECGYDKCSSALVFHHISAHNKNFTLSDNWGLGWERIVQELDKCILLCCRCHVELHAGIELINIK